MIIEITWKVELSRSDDVSKAKTKLANEIAVPIDALSFEEQMVNGKRFLIATAKPRA